MRTPFRLALTAALMFAAFSTPLLAGDDPDGSTDRLDDAWAERALANPELDEGWSQSGRGDWKHGRVAYRDVREFSYPRVSKPVAIDGGQNSGMTVIGWNRDYVRILYRVITRAHTEERARALAEEIKLELTKGWLRPDGPELSDDDWWTVEVKAWVPHTSNLGLRAHNGPMAVRDVHGTMDLSSINGPVSLADLGGAVEVRVENGPLDVALAGSRWDGAGLDAEAQNGPLNLALPADYSARLTTGTINGPRTYDYPIEANRGRAWVTTTLGKGGAPVRVVTNNGPFYITER